MADTPPKMADDDEAARFFKRFARAEDRKKKFNAIIDECYEFALPLRERVYSAGETVPELDRLFSAHAPVTLQDLASQMLDDVWPTDSKPFELRAGKEIPDNIRSQADRQLAEVAEDLIEIINNSNFRSAAHETLMDWGIGTGFMLPEEGDAIDPVNFRCLPLSEAYPDTGPRGDTDALFRQRKPKAGDLRLLYPNGTFSTDLADKIKNHPDTEIEVTEGFERDWKVKGTETWNFTAAVSCDNKKSIIAKNTLAGAGSKPFVDVSFMRVAGEVIGRGPVMVALPDIKDLNIVIESALESMDMAIGGMWQAADDGVINVDTIVIEPRTIIPKAANSKGLERVDTAVDMNSIEFLIGYFTSSINRAMFGDELGPREGTPISATEVMARTSNTARRRAGPYTRLLKELVGQTVRRVAYLRKKQGKLDLPPIDGRRIVLNPLSPLTRAQAQDEILRHDRYLEMMNIRFGPQVTNMKIDQSEYGDWLAKKMGIAPKVVRDKVAFDQLAARIAAMAAQAQAGEGQL